MEVMATFGPDHMRGISVALPMTFTDCESLEPLVASREFCFGKGHKTDDRVLATGQCAIGVSISGPPIQARWYDIWGPPVAIISKCVARGMDGAHVREGMLLMLVFKTTTDTDRTD